MKIKTSISTLLFSFCFIFCNAQQKDYKSFLDTFFLHAENSFKNIAEEPNDSSAFSPCKLKADVGELKIGRYLYTATLNWIIPLAQSKKIQTDVQEYIRTNFLNAPECFRENEPGLRFLWTFRAIFLGYQCRQDFHTAFHAINVFS